MDWFVNPVTGNDEANARALHAAIDLLDTISSAHRTDAFRILATRYAEDLRRMQKEDAERSN